MPSIYLIYDLQYLESFVKHGVTTVRLLQEMTMDGYKEIGIKPDHIRIIMQAALEVTAPSEALLLPFSDDEL